MNGFRTAWSIAVVLAGVLGACKAPPAPPSVVFIRAIDEAKAPVKGAEITAQGSVISQTDANGRAEMTLTGREGTSFLVEVHCPAGFRSPVQPLEVRRLENASAASPEYVTHCDRLRHTLVVDVRTTGATNMPVLHLGKEIQHTDDAGVARIVIEGEVQERVELQLDTSDPKFAHIHPQNPTGSFAIQNQDVTVPFEVKFTVDKKKVIRGKPKTGPVQIH